VEQESEDGERRIGVELPEFVCVCVHLLCVGWIDGDRIDQAGKGSWTGSDSLPDGQTDGRTVGEQRGGE